MIQRADDQIIKENYELRNMLTVARDDNKRLRAENEEFRTVLELIGSCAQGKLEKFPSLPPRSSKVVPIRPTNGSAP